MKILMLIDTLSYGGGAERQFVGLAVSLHRAGYNINVVAYHNGNGYQSELSKDGIEYEILKGCSNQYKKLTKVGKMIKEFEPALVISFKDGPNRIACIHKALGAKWKLIVSDRNTLQNISLPIKVQYDLLYRYADAIVPNSYAQREFIKRHFNHLKDKVEVITNFTNTELFHPNTIQNKNQELKKILIVARIARQKNVLGFIEAAHLLARKWTGKAVIYWYGHMNVSESAYAFECIKLIEKFNLSNFFKFRDPIKDIDKIYRESDIFCLPSLWEGYPNALCEAMASGLPVCASRICDNERIIKDGYNGYLFAPNDPNDIERKIDELLSMTSTERETLGIQARQYTLENLSIVNFVEKYQAVISKLNIGKK